MHLTRHLTLTVSPHKPYVCNDITDIKAASLPYILSLRLASFQTATFKSNSLLLGLSTEIRNRSYLSRKRRQVRKHYLFDFQYLN